MEYFFDLRPFVRGGVYRGRLVQVRAGFTRELVARSVGSSDLLPTADRLVLLDRLVPKNALRE